jgi:hypothetical protein
LIENQVSPECIAVVSEVPFATALRRSFEIALERDLPWTLVVDADMLLRRDAAARLLRIAEVLDHNVFAVQGEIIDKLSGGPRLGGPKLYRTSLLPRALALVPADREATRPEASTIMQMKTQGFPFLESRMSLGLHDYQQWYRDIYRKAFLHSHKFRPAVEHYWSQMWKRLAAQDLDYEVAVLGMRAGCEFDGAVRSDIRQFCAEDIAGIIEEYGIAEKKGLPPDGMSPGQVDGLVDGFRPPPEFWAWCSRSRDPVERPGLLAKLRAGAVEMGWWKVPPWLISGVIIRIGKRLQAWAKS